MTDMDAGGTPNDEGKGLATADPAYKSVSRTEQTTLALFLGCQSPRPTTCQCAWSADGSARRRSRRGTARAALPPNDIYLGGLLQAPDTQHSNVPICYYSYASCLYRTTSPLRYVNVYLS